MINRCCNPSDNNFIKYGGRGIVVCERWLGKYGFVNFLDDMRSKPSPLHSIDRIDGNGDYEPENCRWATASEQAVNRKSTIMLTMDGETRCLKHWCLLRGVSYLMVYKRIKRGVLPERAFDSGKMPTGPRPGSRRVRINEKFVWNP